MRRIFWYLITLFLATTAASAQSENLVPNQRLVFERNTDFFGADIAQLFEMSQQGCVRACMSNTQCQALTYNQKSQSCFIKSEVIDRQEFVGATSARVVPTPPDIVTRAEAAAQSLDFLSKSDLEAAYHAAQDIGQKHPSGRTSAIELMQIVRSAMVVGDYQRAWRGTGQVLALTDSGDLWTDYARLSLNMADSDRRNRRDHIRMSSSAAINGFLRVQTPQARAEALLTLSQALQRSNRGRDSLSALRLAATLSSRLEIARALDEAVRKWGFNMVTYRIEKDLAAPELCITMREELDRSRIDYNDFVSTSTPGLQANARGNDLCIAGLRHGQNYAVTLRKGMPAASGEKLTDAISLDIYVGDRAATAQFPGRGYVLPAGGAVTLPIETVNTEILDLKLYRVSDRALINALQEGFLSQPIRYWRQRKFEDNIGQEIWRGSADIASTLNADTLTRLSLDEVVGDFPVGMYVLQAARPDAPHDESPATQWFMVSDLGLTTMDGSDGLHVFVQSLSKGDPIGKVELSLISNSNAILGTTETDRQGHAVFAENLAKGVGAAAPALVLARLDDKDLGYLSLKDPAFDLSDRGVAGRPAAEPIDVFVATDRGAYRAGETIAVTALVRDDRARSLDGVGLTGILYRPDGVEYRRILSRDADMSGGHVMAFPLGGNVQRGGWRLDLHVDPEAPALASTTLLVEDFLPERIDARLNLPETPIRMQSRPELVVDVNYLFGAPGPNLPVEARVIFRPASQVAGFEGYKFGRHDEARETLIEYNDVQRTDATGRAVIPLRLPQPTAKDRPYEARVIVEAREGSGRPIERRLTRPVATDTKMIGIKPSFEDILDANGTAGFDVIAVGDESLPAQWRLERVNRRYQWYRINGNWRWEPITTRETIDSGAVVLGAQPVSIEKGGLDWGRYQLVIDADHTQPISSSFEFTVGYWADGDASQTPDTLALGLDRDVYSQGDKVQLSFEAPGAGTALITVLSNRVIEKRMIDTVQGSNKLSFSVTPEWGAGAYVTVSHLVPKRSEHVPTRQLGVAYAKIDPGAARLDLSLQTPAEVKPRGPLEVTVDVGNLNRGETAWVTVAAVDVGVLNITGFEAPDPSAYYFGQRRLGVELRDLYGRLIDNRQGALSLVRSGGDSAEIAQTSPPPTQEILALFRGPVPVENGKARVSFDLPQFNGTVRLMAIAWSQTGVGQAQADVLVRDPIVANVTVPRFMAPGDQSQTLFEVTHATGPAGTVTLDLSALGLTLSARDQARQFELAPGESHRFSVPIIADTPGDHALFVTMQTPGGARSEQRLNIPVRRNDPVTTRISRIDLPSGTSLTIDGQAFDGFVPNTASATVSAGLFAQFNVAGLITKLDQYPYGCTEQTVSRAFPLLYMGDTVNALQLAAPDDLRERLESAVQAVLNNQNTRGGFGLWSSYSGLSDNWLDAYATEFLAKARREGIDVPDQAIEMAFNNLDNFVRNADGRDGVGAALAYALYVLAQDGRARMADLRYFADQRAADLPSSMALAHLGTALALYGDQTRARALFSQAETKPHQREDWLWRADYGTNARDEAALHALAMEADISLSAPLEVKLPQNSSTQEATWLLRAAHQLVTTAPSDSISVNGATQNQPVTRVSARTAFTQPVEIENNSARDLPLSLSVRGVATQAPPAGGTGMSINRRYFTLDGAPKDISEVALGTRLVTVLTVQPFDLIEGRLMIDDPLPAGFEIDNPNLLRAGDIAALDWLETTQEYQTVEFRSERFLAALDWRSDSAIRLAYIIRATSAGSFHHPATTVEDMYRPDFRAWGDTGRVTITP